MDTDAQNICSIAKKKVKAVTTCKSGLIYNGREQLLVNNPDNEDYNVINSKAINDDIENNEAISNFKIIANNAFVF